MLARGFRGNLMFYQSSKEIANDVVYVFCHASGKKNGINIKSRKSARDPLPEAQRYCPFYMQFIRKSVKDYSRMVVWKEPCLKRSSR